MKKRYRIIAVIVTMFLIAGSFPVSAFNGTELSTEEQVVENSSQTTDVQKQTGEPKAEDQSEADEVDEPEDQTGSTADSEATADSLPLVQETISTPQVGAVRSFILEHLTELAGEIFNNVTEMALEDINGVTDDPVTHGLCVLLGGATGRALNEIIGEIEKTQEMIEELQESVDLLARETETQLDAIEAHLSAQDFSYRLMALNRTKTTIDRLSAGYSEIIDQCYDGNGKLKESLDANDLANIERFIDDINEADLPGLLDTLNTAVSPAYGSSIYAVQFNYYCQETSFRHKTYMAEYTMANYAAQLRSGLLFFIKEADAYEQLTDYQNSAAGEADPDLENFEADLSLYVSEYYNPTIQKINSELENEAIFKEIQAIFQNVDEGEVPQRDHYESDETFVLAIRQYLTDYLDRLQDAVDDSIVTEIEVYQPDGSRAVEKAYQVVSNRDGKKYYISLQNHTMNEYVYRETERAGGDFDKFVYYKYNGYHADYGVALTTNGRYCLPNSIDDAKGLFNSAANTTAQLSWLIQELRDSDGNCLLSGDHKMLLTTGKKTVSGHEDGLGIDKMSTITIGTTQKYDQLQLVDANDFSAADSVEDHTPYLQYDGHNFGASAVYYDVTYTFAGDISASVVKDVPLLMIYMDREYGSVNEKPITAGDMPASFDLGDQTLDLSALTETTLSKTITISGNATIKGGGKSFSELKIYLCEGAHLTLEDIQLTGSSTPISVYGKNTVLDIRGSVSITASGSSNAISAAAESEVFTLRGSDDTAGNNTLILASGGGVPLKAVNSLAVEQLNLTLNTSGEQALAAGADSRIVDAYIDSKAEKEGNKELAMTSGEMTRTTLNLNWGSVDGEIAKTDVVWTNKVRIKVKLTTGDVENASSDEVISMTIYSANDNHETKNFYVEEIGKASGDQFERDQVDILYYSAKASDFFLDQKGVALTIPSVTLEIKGDDGWYVNTVEVAIASEANLGADTGYHLFNFYNWLDTDSSATLAASSEDGHGFFTIKTADVDNAGTASNISVTVEYRTHSGLIYTMRTESLTNRTRNAEFAAGSTETVDVPVYYNDAENIAEITGFYITSDHSGKKAGWKLEEISFTFGDITAKATPNQWFLESGVKGYFGASWDTTGQVELVTKTANADKAGTDAQFKMTIVSDNYGQGSSEFRIFDDYCENQNHDCMEKGMTDTFHLAYSRAIKNVAYIIIESDGSGSGPTWECDTMDLTLRGNDGSTKTYHFSVYSKLGKGTYTFWPDGYLTSSQGAINVDSSGRYDETKLQDILTSVKDNQLSFHLTDGNGGGILSADFLNRLAEAGKTLILEHRDNNQDQMLFQWIIRGSILGNIYQDVDFHAVVNSSNLSEQYGVSITQPAVGVDLTAISWIPEGVSINLNGSLYGFEPEDTVYLYSWDSETKMFKLLDSTLKADHHGNILFDVDSGIHYFLSSQRLNITESTGNAEGNSTNNTAGTVQTAAAAPATGTDAQTSPLAAILICLAAAGTSLLVWRRRV